MSKQAILTSASNKFFPSVLNLIGSIKKNYPNHPPIVVFDLGLMSFFRNELKTIPNVQVISIPPFSPFWKSCYTWKSYIFTHPPAELNIYLDAGCEVRMSLDELYTHIEKNDFFTVEQNTILDYIVPQEYKHLIPVRCDLLQKNCVTAGIFGFKRDSTITPILQRMHEASLAGLCLGFSKNELWRNVGKNKSNFIRNCPVFRHDTTLLSMLIASHYPDHSHLPVSLFDGVRHDHEKQYIWNLRLSYKKLSHISLDSVHKNKFTITAVLNRVIITVVLHVRNIWRKIKAK